MSDLYQEVRDNWKEWAREEMGRRKPRRTYLNRYLFSEEGMMRVNTQRLSRDYRDEQFKRYKESGSMLALYAAATHAKMLNEWPEGLAEAMNAEVEKMKELENGI